MTTTQTKLTPPVTPGEWTLKQTIEALSRPIPRSMLGVLKDKGNCQYIPWYTANTVLDKYCPGWTWEITQTTFSADRIYLVGRLTITTSEGRTYREATGTETLKFTKKDGTIIEQPMGDPSSNAESMAFRRACAKFGLGLYLYDK